MAKVADIGGKRLLGLAPDAWAKWVTQQDDVTVLEILGSDFQWISRENDVLMTVHSPIYRLFGNVHFFKVRSRRLEETSKTGRFNEDRVVHLPPSTLNSKNFAQ